MPKILSTEYVPGRRQPQRALPSKPDAPGTEVRWTETGGDSPGAPPVERSGQIWCGAPGARCVWVVPHEPREGEHAVKVRLGTDGRGERRGAWGVNGLSRT